MRDFESFETIEEVLEHVSRAGEEFQSSIDFALMSERTFDYIMTLGHSMTAIARIMRIKINNHRLRTMEGDS